MPIRKNRPIIRLLYTLSITVFILGLVTSCKSVSNIYESEAVVASSFRTDLIEDARSLIGSSYLYAGKGPKKFDCSGLVGYVYGLSNIKAVGSSKTLSEEGDEITLKELQLGDLVFFKRKGKVFHVSIVSQLKGSEIWVIHSTSSRGVIEEDIMASNYWRPLVHKTVSLSSYR